MFESKIQIVVRMEKLKGTGMDVQMLVYYIRAKYLNMEKAINKKEDIYLPQ